MAMSSEITNRHCPWSGAVAKTDATKNALAALGCLPGAERVMPVQILQGDCLSVMERFPAEMVDMVLVDLPYGTTYAPWDSVIPLDALWAGLLRVSKPKAAMVFTASQPFTSQLVMSHPDLFRCEWIWDKVNAANFANANKQPLKSHESVLVFATGQTIYHPQKIPGKPNHVQGKNAKANSSEIRLISQRVGDDPSGMKFPKSIQIFPKHSSQSRLHSAQKPEALCEYFIRTYSNVGDLILDCTAGSGTTGVAALHCGRRAILIDNSSKSVATMQARLGIACTECL